MANTPGKSPLDERLARAFAGLDLDPGFDARLAARLTRESQQELVERALRARQLEQERYRIQRSLRGWRQDARSLLSVVTLETAGIAGLIGVVIFAGWGPLTAWVDAHVDSGLLDALRQNSDIIWPSTVGVLLGIAPLLAQRWRRSERST